VVLDALLTEHRSIAERFTPTMIGQTARGDGVAPGSPVQPSLPNRARSHSPEANDGESGGSRSDRGLRKAERPSCRDGTGTT
jgi:hypothetical protein